MGLFFLILGFFVSGIGLYLLIFDYGISKRGYFSQGTVTEIIGKWEFTGSSISYLYYPVVAFKLKNGQQLEMRLELGISLPLFTKGQTIKVVYSQNKVYPAGLGWKMFYWALFLTGLNFGIYHSFTFTKAEILETWNILWAVF